MAHLPATSTPPPLLASQTRFFSSPLRPDTPEMSKTTTLLMQDLDVGDGNNMASSLMIPATAKNQVLPPIRTVIPPSLIHPSYPTQSNAPRTRRRRSSVQSIPTVENHNVRPGQTQTCQEDCEDESLSAYCYRHRPDLQHIRQADDFSLDRVKQSSQQEFDAMPLEAQRNIHQAWDLFSGGSTRQRRLMLRGMLAQCCFPQLSFVAATVREMLKIDFLSALPQELGLKILCFLDSRSLCHAAQVSQAWKSLADDDVIWHRMCEQHIDRKCTTCGWGLPLLDRQRLQVERRNVKSRLVHPPPLPLPTTHTKSAMSHDEIHEYPDSASDDGDSSTTMKHGSRKRPAAAVVPEHQIAAKKACTPAHNYAIDESYFQNASPIRLRPWKDVYRDRFIIGTNWKHGRCTTKTLKGHTSAVTCLQFDDEIMATGSYDTTIKIWNVETGAELKTLTGHTMGVKCLQFDKTKLVSGSLDGTLKMWDLRNGRVIRTFPGHSGAVVSVHFDGSILASGSQDRTVRVRDFANCSRVSLKGHTDYVNSVRVHAASQTLFSSSDDCTVRVWDLQGKRCLRVLRGHSLQVTQVLPMPCGFEAPLDLTDDDDRSIASGDGRVVTVPVAYPRTPPEGRCPPTYILTCSMDSTVRLWEVSSGRCIRTFFGHFEGIWAIAADTLRIISGANDGCVKIWDTRTGKQERSFVDHSAPVTCVGLNDRRMVTAGEDNEVRIYNFGGDVRMDRFR